ncbi:MAG: thioesterase [Gammaproteobacteria bacterium]|nr:MAG: thioesterase [Gammaproteobacteria bacterium]
MKPSLKVGIKYEHKFVLPDNKTVPDLYPESPEFVEMPKVFATGFMVGFVEWACIMLIKPHLKQGEQSLGIGVNLNHTAATPMGFKIISYAELVKIDGNKLDFKIKTYDNFDLISAGTHSRFVIDRKRFDDSLQRKIKKTCETSLTN